MEKIKPKELVSLLNKELTRMQYKNSSLIQHRRNWAKLVVFFEEIQEEYFSMKTAMKYLDDTCDFFAKEKANELTSGNTWLYRSIKMLCDFYQHGTLLRRHTRTNFTVNKAFHQELLTAFHTSCVSMDYALSTTKGYLRTVSKLLSFIESKEIIARDLDPSILAYYVKTLLGYSPKMVEFTFCGIRSFLRFLHVSGYIKRDLSNSLPTVKIPQKARIPSTWNPTDLKKLLEVIDRGNPSGKRDYAIILLASRLGMRCVDIKSLKFDDIKWDENRIEITQVKTRKPTTYPLSREIGWALIDYIQKGRPNSEDKNVFVRHTAPICSFGDSSRLMDMIKKYMKMAHISIPQDRKFGMHSLRHTYATSLMERHVPIEEIAQLMGHVDTTTTAIYLKSSLNLLKECTLNIDDL